MTGSVLVIDRENKYCSFLSYCPDILTQVSAINSALNSFNKELLASHMKSCVVNDIRAGKDEIIDELVITLQKIMK